VFLAPKNPLPKGGFGVTNISPLFGNTFGGSPVWEPTKERGFPPQTHMGWREITARGQVCPFGGKNLVGGTTMGDTPREVKG